MCRCGWRGANTASVRLHAAAEQREISQRWGPKLLYDLDHRLILITPFDLDLEDLDLEDLDLEDLDLCPTLRWRSRKGNGARNDYQHLIIPYAFMVA